MEVIFEESLGILLTDVFNSLVTDLQEEPNKEWNRMDRNEMKDHRAELINCIIMCM